MIFQGRGGGGGGESGLSVPHSGSVHDWNAAGLQD